MRTGTEGVRMSQNSTPPITQIDHKRQDEVSNQQSPTLTMILNYKLMKQKQLRNGQK